MGVYYVGIREVHVVSVKVHLDDDSEKLDPEAKADRIKELAEMKNEMGAEEMVEYSHTMKKEHWSIEKVG